MGTALISLSRLNAADSSIGFCPAAIFNYDHPAERDVTTSHSASFGDSMSPATKNMHIPLSYNQRDQLFNENLPFLS
jgi:hypothetical protein